MISLVVNKLFETLSSSIEKVSKIQKENTQSSILMDKINAEGNKLDLIYAIFKFHLKI